MINSLTLYAIVNEEQSYGIMVAPAFLDAVRF